MPTDTARHYDALIDEGNDPVLDTPVLASYMDKYDGRLFFELLSLTSEQDVLEIGCGSGRLAVKTAPRVRSFCGIDLSPKTVNAAKQHLEGKNVTLICGDFLTYPLEKRFDLIYSSLTFFHIEEKHKAINKVFALLNTGGRFVLSIDKSRSDILDYGSRKLKLYPDTPEALVNIMKDVGFSDIEKYETELAYILTAKAM